MIDSDPAPRFSATSPAHERAEVAMVLVLFPIPAGWALDPARAGEAVRAAAGAREGIHTLRPLMQMAISANPAGEPSQIREGETR